MRYSCYSIVDDFFFCHLLGTWTITSSALTLLQTSVSSTFVHGNITICLELDRIDRYCLCVYVACLTDWHRTTVIPTYIYIYTRYIYWYVVLTHGRRPSVPSLYAQSAKRSSCCLSRSSNLVRPLCCHLCTCRVEIASRFVRTPVHFMRDKTWSSHEKSVYNRTELSLGTKRSFYNFHNCFEAPYNFLVRSCRRSSLSIRVRKLEVGCGWNWN